jgi:hypothetical protein
LNPAHDTFAGPPPSQLEHNDDIQMTENPPVTKDLYPGGLCWFAHYCVVDQCQQFWPAQDKAAFTRELPFKHVNEFLSAYRNHKKSAGEDQLQQLHVAWRKLHTIAKHLASESFLNIDLDFVKWPKKGSSSLAEPADYTALNVWLTDSFGLGSDEEDNEGSQNPGPSKVVQGKMNKGNTTNP